MSHLRHECGRRPFSCSSRSSSTITEASAAECFDATTSMLMFASFFVCFFCWNFLDQLSGSRHSTAQHDVGPSDATCCRFGASCGAWVIHQSRTCSRHHVERKSSPIVLMAKHFRCIPGYRLARRVRYSGEHEMAMDRFQVRREPPPMNGGYQDYLREYHHHQRPPMPPMPYGPPPPFPMDAMSYHYERAIQHIDYNHGVPPRPPRVLEKRSYEMTVDDFIRRTARPPPSRAERSGRYRERR
ncbi:unnamed protein product [Ixodes pacificus]